eukprot:CAMPEP_0171934750 /NCGR_PEP_ID=MMETSP0993-20121228/32284_1 /TAXON_ID=483369 /ORGANISM="non described non described, Strain CCMP2098" /LENGTH=62 /DNA_ID=CAMNT_0012575519 /DNA_START=333 /DNA_END=517 /DNA_ORIENTATION=-
MVPSIAFSACICHTVQGVLAPLAPPLPVVAGRSCMAMSFWPTKGSEHSLEGGRPPPPPPPPP